MNDILPSVTIIMPVLNEARFIRQSLGAALAQDYPAGNLEVLVVDGGSGDDTRRIVGQLAAQHPNLRLLDNPRRVQAAAMNVGIRAAAGDVIVRVDGHTVIAPDYVRACVDVLHSGRADNVGGMMKAQGSSWAGQAIALAVESPFGIGGSKFHYTDREQFVDTVYLGAFRRNRLLKLGGYDESFHINEDYELNIRLRQAGGKILLSPAVKSVYTPRESLAALWRQYFKYGRWKVRTLRKHPASLKVRQAAAPLFVLALLVGLIAGFFWSPGLWLFGVAAGSYLLANLLASTMAAAKGGWRYWPLLPPAFFCIHIAWGLGFWAGVFFTPAAKLRSPD